MSLLILMKNLLSKTAALAAGIVFLIIALETGLTLFGIVEAKKTRALSKGKTDTKGYRVLCLGDSNTVGLGAPAGQSYPDHLENILRAQMPVGAKVTNAGMLAANTYQILSNLEKNMEKFNPDVVVLTAGGANFWNFFGCYSFQSPDSFKAKLTNLLYRIKTFRLIKLLAKNIKEKHQRARPAQPVAETSPPSVEQRLAKLPTNMDGIKLPPQPQTTEIHKQLILNACKLKPEDWDNPGTMNDTGEAQNKAGNFPLAIICFERALELRPWDSRALYWLGNTYSSKDNQAKALSYLLKGFLANPLESPTANKIGVAFFRLNNYEKALRWALYTIKLAPFKKDYYYYLSPCLIKLKNPDWAQKKIKELVAQNPSTAKYFATVSPNTNVNDFASEWIKSDVRKIHTICKNHGIPLVLQTYLVDKRASAITRQLAKQDKIPLADSEKTFLEIEPKGVEKQEYLAPDRHPNSKGYKVMAQTVADTLARQGLILTNHDNKESM